MTAPPVIVGVSLKSYFGISQTRDWCARVSRLLADWPAADRARVEVFVLPAFPAIPIALSELAAGEAAVGSQCVSPYSSGPFTGEVTASVLAELGCRYAAVGHAERRRLFGETDDVVAAQVLAAMTHRLRPVICVGEPDRWPAERAARFCQAQVTAALEQAVDAGLAGPVVVAYEPVWAIGADRPAPDEHIRAVCESIAASLPLASMDGRVIYGGAAGPGLLQRLAGSVSGLFLGRFAHDPAAFARVLTDAVEIAGEGAWMSA